MKRILLVLIVIFSYQAEQQVYAISVKSSHIPAHWYDGMGTNYINIAYTTNIYDTGINEITNIVIDTASSEAEDYFYIGSFYPLNMTTTFLNEVESGRFQSLSLDQIDYSLGLLYTNYLHNLASNMYTTLGYGYVPVDPDSDYPKIPTNYLNITSYPTIVTNGLITKKFEFTWVMYAEIWNHGGDPVDYNDGIQTELIVLDNSSIRRVESFAVIGSPDLAFTTNIQYYLETDDPILDGTSSEGGSNNYFTGDGGLVSYVKLTATTNSESYLELRSGEIAYIQYSRLSNYRNRDYSGYGYYIEIDVGNTGYYFDGNNYYDNMKYHPSDDLSSIDNIMGPAVVKLAFNSYSDYFSPNSYFSTGEIIYRIERSESSYLSSLESLIEQLSNTVSQTTTSTMTVTNTVHKTITNTVDFTLSEMADLRYGSKMIEVSNNTANLTFRIDAVSNLESNWNPIMDITVPFDMGSSDIGFFRVRGADELTTNEVGGAESPPNMEVTPPAGIMNTLHEDFRNSTTTPDGGGFDENDSTQV